MMLGGGLPLGAAVLGQISPPSVYVLPVTAGTCQLTGVTQPALVVTLPATTATFTLTGKDAPLVSTVRGQSGPYALTGIGATFRGTLVVSAASYALVGQGIAFDPIEREETGAYQVAGLDAYLSYDLLGGGSSISGGTFSRQRW